MLAAPHSLGGGGGLVQGVKSRPDVDYARVLVGILPGDEDQYVWEPHGWCEMPDVDLFVSKTLHPHVRGRY
jgi:ER degradation enhancer, mannosidase alpha-like 1